MRRVLLLTLFMAIAISGCSGQAAPPDRPMPRACGGYWVPLSLKLGNYPGAARDTAWFCRKFQFREPIPETFIIGLS